jgi:hypothetical protein
VKETSVRQAPSQALTLLMPWNSNVSAGRPKCRDQVGATKTGGLSGEGARANGRGVDLTLRFQRCQRQKLSSAGKSIGRTRSGCKAKAPPHFIRICVDYFQLQVFNSNRIGVGKICPQSEFIHFTFCNRFQI